LLGLIFSMYHVKTLLLFPDRFGRLKTANNAGKYITVIRSAKRFSLDKRFVLYYRMVK